MWHPASSYASGSIRLKDETMNQAQESLDCSEDDEVSSMNSKDACLECQICWESFNLVENVPYVLWCGHTLCKNCILGLQWAFLKFPASLMQLPFVISCPWCNVFSLRILYRGNLKFPRKNFFLLWMLEKMNGDGVKSHSSICAEHHTFSSSSTHAPESFLGSSNRTRHNSDHSEPSRSSHDANQYNRFLSIDRLHLRKTLVFFLQLTAKFPLILIFLLVILYAIPASAAVLLLYILITVFFALPSFFMLYFSYPILDWLVREIIT